MCVCVLVATVSLFPITGTTCTAGSLLAAAHAFRSGIGEVIVAIAAG